MNPLLLYITAAALITLYFVLFLLKLRAIESSYPVLINRWVWWLNAGILLCALLCLIVFAVVLIEG